MRDYIELVKALMCCVDGSCEGCPRLQTPEGEFDCKNKLKTDAADAIEELLGQHEADAKEIAWLKKCVQDLPKPPRWISVEDEKNRPACGERVNLTDGIAVFEGFLSISGKWMISFGEFAATHWLPLPAPPKEVV